MNYNSDSQMKLFLFSTAMSVSAASPETSNENLGKLASLTFKISNLSAPPNFKSV